MGIFEAFQEQLGSERNADPRRQHFLNTRMCYPPLIVTSMNMSNDSLSIASLNLEAFKLIAHGQYGQSVRLLEAAVRALHTEVRCVNLSNNDVEQIQNETLELVAEKVGRNTDSQEEGGVFQIYDRSLLVKDGYEKTDENQRRVAQTLIYNMALAYHMSAEKNQGRTRYYRKALKLYRVASQMHDECSDLAACDYHVRMACLNNMGCIYGQFSDLCRTRECLVLLRSVLDHFQVLDCCEGIEHEDESHFSLTVALYARDGCQYTIAAGAA